MSRVVVVGAGIAGVSCARGLADAGIRVQLVDRGRRLGGRIGARTEDAGARRHVVDTGAAYLTARDPGFVGVVNEWESRGLARRWTDTFALASPDDGITGTTTGPVRWAARDGLRSLVEDLAAGLDVSHPHEVEEVTPGASGLPEVDGDGADAVVLAMPDPQALDLLSESYAAERRLLEQGRWAPVISVWAAWGERWWGEVDGVFVRDSPVLDFVADDGSRRGDDAAVLVAHSSRVFAAGRLENPPASIAPVLAELGRVLRRGGAARRVPEPEYARVHRWSLATPVEPRDEPFFLGDARVGLCGDGWGPRPRVEQAWLSGRALGAALVSRLGPT